MKQQSARRVVFVPQPDERGHYELRIPLDRYLTGSCEWQPYSLGVRLSNDKNADAAGFVVYGKPSSGIPTVYNRVCGDTPGSCRVRIPKGTNAIFRLSGTQSSTQNFNLLKKTD